jgi:hypothetical protein
MKRESRRNLVFIAAVSCLAGLPALALAKDEKTKDDESPGKADAGKGTPKKSEGAVVTVVVTGNGKPISQAEVMVKLPPSVGGEIKLPTDSGGSATFKSAGLGAAKVRVIAAGWESALQNVTLKEGAQRVTISLNPLPVPKQADEAKKAPESKASAEVKR